jgi:hypothetical protein
MKKAVKARMILKLFGAILGLCLILSTSEAQANLLTNGGFEEPALGWGGWSIVASMPGWSGGAGGIEIQNHAAGSPYEGKQHIELDAYANSSMSQTINTEPGKSYSIRRAPVRHKILTE